MKDIKIIPTHYLISGGNIKLAIALRHHERDVWAITGEDGSHMCLNKQFEWEHEPLPSSRTESFFERCRFTLEEAKQTAIAYITKEKALREKSSKNEIPRSIYQ